MSNGIIYWDHVKSIKIKMFQMKTSMRFLRSIPKSQLKQSADCPAWWENQRLLVHVCYKLTSAPQKWLLYGRITLMSLFCLSSFWGLVSQDGESQSDNPLPEVVKHRRVFSRGPGNRPRGYKVKTSVGFPSSPPVCHLIRPGSSCIFVIKSRLLFSNRFITLN